MGRGGGDSTSPRTTVSTKEVWGWAVRGEPRYSPRLVSAEFVLERVREGRVEKG